MFKQMKDMKKTVAAAPDLVDQAMQMSQQAQHMQAAQQAAMAQAPMGGVAASAGELTGPDAEPIAGVSLEQYAAICRAMGGVNDPSVATAHGVAPDAWQAAQDGWTARMQRNHAVGRQFNTHFLGR
jgi:hypothetical protein